MTQQATHTVEELKAHEEALKSSNPTTYMTPKEVSTDNAMTPEQVEEIKQDHLIGDADDATRSEAEANTTENV